MPMADPTPPPGSLRITSAGHANNSKIEALGADGQWISLRYVESVTVTIAGPDAMARAFLVVSAPFADIVAQSPHVSWTYAGEGDADG
jgi:hypothetical protein